MYELARGENVVLLESFSKSLLPGLRIGVMLAGHVQANGQTLAEKLSSIKSYVSVATSPLNQAALGGFLISQNYSFDPWMKARIRHVKNLRDLVVDHVDREFSSVRSFNRAKPKGGFFYSFPIDREFTIEDCVACAREADVLVMPMTLFSVNGRFKDWVRLAFSNVDADAIGPAIARFQKWLYSGRGV
jgi:(S)-3,5-dihydroxyphenylglycine transaminase